MLDRFQDDETLDDLDVGDVFERCLAIHAVPDEQRPDLVQSYNEIVHGLSEEDPNSE